MEVVPRLRPILLIGHHIRYDATSHQFGIYFGRIANQPDREWLTLIAGLTYLVQGLVKRAGNLITVACLKTPLDTVWINLYSQTDTFVHRNCQGLHTTVQMPLNEAVRYPS
jgi:hypothetical protein